MKQEYPTFLFISSQRKTTTVYNTQTMPHRQEGPAAEIIGLNAVWVKVYKTGK